MLYHIVTHCHRTGGGVGGARMGAGTVSRWEPPESWWGRPDTPPSASPATQTISSPAPGTL